MTENDLIELKEIDPKLVDDIELQVDTESYPSDAKLQEYYEKRLVKNKLKVISKNRREIKRLKKLAEKALLANKFDSYRYALCKLREFYRQPFTPEIIKTMWDTSRAELFRIAKGNT
ncbi:hypothetical protein TH2_160 [Shewanella phage Thanatos-2]|nr:hypothetical protein TH2_160 [Shewanella phage Thanatos-2]